MPQASSSGITILPVPQASTVAYLPEIHSKHGIYIPELRRGDTTKATIVADIASSQHEDVRRVIGIDLTAGTSWDASQEIARAVLDCVLVEHTRVPSWCIDFLEEHLGVNYVRSCEREAA